MSHKLEKHLKSSGCAMLLSGMGGAMLGVSARGAVSITRRARCVLLTTRKGQYMVMSLAYITLLACAGSNAADLQSSHLNGLLDIRVSAAVMLAAHLGQRHLGYPRFGWSGSPRVP